MDLLLARGRGRRLLRAVVIATAVITAAGTLTAVTATPPAVAAVKPKNNDYNRDGVSDIVAIRLFDKCLYRWYGNGGFGAGTRVGCNWEQGARSSRTVPGSRPPPSTHETPTSFEPRPSVFR